MIRTALVAALIALPILLVTSNCNVRVWPSGTAPPPQRQAESKSMPQGNSSAKAPAADDQTPAQWTPKIAQHGLLVRCGGAAGPPHDPIRIANELRRDPDAFFNRHAERALRLHEITGNARIVFHMVNGWDHLGMTRSAAVLDAMPPQRRRAFEAMAKRLTEAGVTVGVYFSSKVPQVTNSVMVRDVDPLELFEYNNPRHRKIMVEGIIDPLLEIGVTEMWLDAASASATRREFAKLAEELRPRGAYLVMEATPRLRGGAIDLPVASRIASVSMDRLIYNSNDLRNDHWLPLPANSEFVAVISGHQTRGNQVPESPAARRAYLVGQAEKRLAQGFSVFLMDEAIDNEFRALVRAWKTQRDGAQSASR